MSMLAIVILPWIIRIPTIISQCFFPTLGFHINNSINCLIVVVFGLMFSVLCFVVALFYFRFLTNGTFKIWFSGLQGWKCTIVISHNRVAWNSHVMKAMHVALRRVMWQLIWKPCLSSIPGRKCFFDQTSWKKITGSRIQVIKKTFPIPPNYIIFIIWKMFKSGRTHFYIYTSKKIFVYIIKIDLIMENPFLPLYSEKIIIYIINIDLIKNSILWLGPSQIIWLDIRDLIFSRVWNPNFVSMLTSITFYFWTLQHLNGFDKW